jgi:hypothetical protein
MGTALPVDEGSGVVNRQPDLLAVLRIGDHSESRFQPAREVRGGPIGGHVFHAHLREGLVMDEEGMDTACVAAIFGHDDPFRVGTHHWLLSSRVEDTFGSAGKPADCHASKPPINA